MGIAVTLVMVLATLVTWPLYTYIMVPLGIEYLEIIFFIFVIAALVQMLEKIIEKLSPAPLPARWASTFRSSPPTAPF